MKRHFKSRAHLNGVQKLRNQNPLLSPRGLMKIIYESSEVKKRNDTRVDDILILIDNVLLAVKMNNSMLPVQHINDHMAKYVHVLKNWRSKNYAYEFLECIDFVIKKEVMKEIAFANFHTLTVDESTHISVRKCLILYFKYRDNTYETLCEYKTRFGGIIQLQLCDATSMLKL